MAYRQWVRRTIHQDKWRPSLALPALYFVAVGGAWQLLALVAKKAAVGEVLLSFGGDWPGSCFVKSIFVEHSPLRQFID